MAWLAALDPARRNRLAGAVLLSIVAAVGLSVWASQETYVTVVSGRGYDSAMAAAAAVEKAGIRYRIRSPDTLEVPTAQVGAASAAISADSDVALSPPTDIFSTGQTPRAQEWTFLRTNEANIARTLNQFDGIVASQVHIVPRQQELYLDEQRPASASVFLRLEPGVSMSQGQVRAIVSTVANAVDGLSPDRVAVADDRGTLLSTGDGAESEGPLASTRTLAEYQSQMERRFEQAVSQALLPVLGYGGGFSVTTSVDLDLTSSSTTTHQVDVQKQAVVSEVLEENSSQGATRPTGVPGVDANLPEGGNPSASTQVAGASTARSSNTVNYEYPRVDEVATRPAGGLKRVSVAVQVDQARLQQIIDASKDGDAGVDAVKAQIEGAVRASVGFDQKRGDVVTVTYLPFAPADWITESEPPLGATTMVRELVPYVGAALAVFLLFWFVVRPIVGVVVRPLEPVPVGAELLPAHALAVDADEDLAVRLKTLVDNFQPIDPSDLNRLVDREAETAADVLRKWSRARTKGA